MALGFSPRTAFFLSSKLFSCCSYLFSPLCICAACDSMRYFHNPYPSFSSAPAEERAAAFPPSAASARIVDIVEKIDRGSNGIAREIDGAVYVGPAGVAYALLHVAGTGVFQDSSPLLQRADSYIRANYDYAEKRAPRRRGEKVGFLIGYSGVYAVDAAVGKALGDEGRTRRSLAKFNEIAGLAVEGACNSDELLVGRAGYVCGSLWLNRTVSGGAVPAERIARVCDAMVSSGREYSRRRRSPSPLMYQYYDTEYLGAAHGLCSILQMLLSAPGYLDSRPDAKADVEGSLRYLLSIQTAEGNFPCAMDEVPGIGSARRSEDELVHWCHGAPGTIYLLARAYLAWKKEEHLRAALKCGDLIWRKGLLKKGPGICHGVAGNGYAFLLLYRLTGDQEHLYRARCFADFLGRREFAEGARTPDCPLSLYEGLAGTACFLADLARPDGATFPFFDIF